jgi:amino acid adenylation domain-containing protein/thioester reductase-like protein
MFNCFLIGENHLLVQCTEILTEIGFNILGVISKFSEVGCFSLEKNIPFFNSIKEAEKSILESEVDYFFSVVNYEIIPKKIISHVNKFCINYHDAPLPKYAGTNATCWAILNNENKHGITWHVVNEIIDGGDILKQILFPIDKDETALSLNLKCHQYAIRAFKELATELKQGSFTQTPQDLTHRTYYNRKKKPLGNGWVRWESWGEEIERYYRACYLGHYTNYFCTLKFIIGSNAYIITKLSLDSEASIEKPGTIIECLSTKWKISTISNPILISEVNTPYGQIVPLNILAKHFNIKLGSYLESPPLSCFEDYQRLSSELFSYETYWAEKFRSSSSKIPFLEYTHPSYFGRSFVQLQSLDIGDTCYKPLENFNSSIKIVLLTIWLVYLYRLGNEEKITIALSYPKLRTIPGELIPLVNTFIPFDVQFTEDMSFIEALDCVQSAYTFTEEKMSCLCDLPSRYSFLKENFREIGVGVVFYGENEAIQFEQFINCYFLLAINITKKTISFYLQKSLIKSNYSLIQVIRNMRGHLQTLIKSIMTEENIGIRKIPLLTEHEKTTIIEKWNATSTQFLINKSLAEIFEEQAVLTPDRIALKDNDLILTYQELNNFANGVARCLIKNGIKRKHFVVLVSQGNYRFITSMLALLKIGAIYIPIDPNVPAHNVEIILQDSRASFVLISKECLGLLNELDSLRSPLVLNIEDCLELSVKESKANLDKVISSKDIAYVMYTSGTTGKPKGVIVPHYAISRLVKNTNYIKINSQDKIAQASSISFDASTFEIWGAILNGGCLICLSRSLLLNPTKFAQFLESEGISILWLTSELFNQYSSINPAMFRNLTYLLAGGDVLNPEKVKLVLECSFGSPKYFLNGYGPTENTTFTTTFLISKRAIRKARIPIGKPISNTSVYVLDKMLEPVPVGVAGDLYTGGMGLAYGYLNLPDLTSEKFIANPFSDQPNDKLYRTGDRVRWLPDGNLDYLGREDRQVKIRGLRVEIEAIQEHIIHYPAVSQCFVTTYNNKLRGKLLVAYIVPSKGDKLNIGNLKKFLGKFLPNFMIPNNFVLLDKLPLTQNGKVDTKILPDPLLRHPIFVKKGEKITNKLQEKLIEIWSRLFSLEEISTNDDFFSLGGTSLLMTRLIIELEKNFKFSLSLPAFFQEPTINGLTHLISQQQHSEIPNPNLKIIFQDINFDVKSIVKKVTTSASLLDDKAALLTGATGFLGAHLLNDLVQLTDKTVFCLVRPNNFVSVDNFIDKIYSNYQLIIPKSRIVIIVGDLTLPYLGLTRNDLEGLAKKISVIYHNAAYVHHVFSYELLREANVLGTIEIIKLASLANLPLHYISTLSAVLNFVDDSGMIKEEFVKDSRALLMVLDGYSQTKFVSECLLHQASNNGLSVNIYRPAWILGQEKTGIIEANNNHLLLLIKGCIQMGYAPSWNVKLNISPVDFISKLVVGISCFRKELPHIFNVGNTEYINWLDLVEALIEHFPNLRIISEDVWREKLRSIDERNALFQLLPLYLNSNKEWIANLEKICDINHSNTSFALRKLGLNYPIINKELLSRYINYLQQTGFFNIYGEIDEYKRVI